MASNKMAGIKRHQLEQRVKIAQEVIDNNVRHIMESSVLDLQHRSQANNCALSAMMLAEYLQKNGFKKAKFTAGIASFGVNDGDMGVMDFGYSVVRETGFDGHCWVAVPECDCLVDLTLVDLERSLLSTNAAMGITNPKDQEFHLSKKVIVDNRELKKHDRLVCGEKGYNYLKQADKQQEIDHKLNELQIAFPEQFNMIRVHLGI